MKKLSNLTCFGRPRPLGAERVVTAPLATTEATHTTKRTAASSTTNPTANPTANPTTSPTTNPTASPTATARPHTHNPLTTNQFNTEGGGYV